jgi:hypothetical protein
MPKKKDEVAIMTKVDVELYHSATPSKDPRCSCRSLRGSLSCCFGVNSLSCVPAEGPSSGFMCFFF